MQNAATDRSTSTAPFQPPSVATRNNDGDLARVIADQSRVFEQAVRTIENLQSGVDFRDPASQPDIEKLQAVLEQITQAQSRVAAAHQAFKQSGRPMSIGLQDQLHQHEDVLRTLLERFASVQHLFESARQDLIPQLDEDSRRRCMQTAYQRSLKTI